MFDRDLRLGKAVIDQTLRHTGLSTGTTFTPKDFIGLAGLALYWLGRRLKPSAAPPVPRAGASLELTPPTSG